MVVGQALEFGAEIRVKRAVLEGDSEVIMKALVEDGVLSLSKPSYSRC